MIESFLLSLSVSTRNLDLATEIEKLLMRGSMRQIVGCLVDWQWPSLVTAEKGRLSGYSQISGQNVGKFSFLASLERQ